MDNGSISDFFICKSTNCIGVPYNKRYSGPDVSFILNQFIYNVIRYRVTADILISLWSSLDVIRDTLFMDFKIHNSIVCEFYRNPLCAIFA